MDAALQLVDNLVALFQSLIDVVVALLNIVLPWLPLLAWIAFWTLAVNWVKAFDILRKGGFVGVLLLMFVAVLVWVRSLLLSRNTITCSVCRSQLCGKFIYVTLLTCIALLCGSAQMNGFAKSLCHFEDEPEASSHHSAH